MQDVCAEMGDETLTDAAFGKNHACVEHGCGGPMNAMDCDTKDVVSTDMKNYPTSFQGMCDTKPYFERYG